LAQRVATFVIVTTPTYRRDIARHLVTFSSSATRRTSALWHEKILHNQLELPLRLTATPYRRSEEMRIFRHIANQVVNKFQQCLESNTRQAGRIVVLPDTSIHMGTTLRVARKISGTFCDVTPGNLVEFCRCFKDISCLHLQVRLDVTYNNVRGDIFPPETSYDPTRLPTFKREILWEVQTSYRLSVKRSAVVDTFTFGRRITWYRNYKLLLDKFLY
jgi:hypothetical protein